MDGWCGWSWGREASRGNRSLRVLWTILNHSFNKCFLSVKCFPGNFIRITITNKQVRCLLFEEIDNKQIYKQEDVGGSLSREGGQGTPVNEVTFELRPEG